jgi:hypothetical protein
MFFLDRFFLCERIFSDPTPVGYVIDASKFLDGDDLSGA